MTELCRSFFRANNGTTPLCGEEYCHWSRNNDVRCPIKPEWGSNKLQVERK